MNVLLIGSGGREHALAWKLAQSPRLTKLFIAPGNAGTGTLGENVSIDIKNHKAIVQFAKDNAIEFVVVGPDDSLAEGLVDSLKEAHILSFGPSKKAAQLESSKAFAKDFMKRHGIPTAYSETFNVFEDALAYAKTHSLPLVIKADGLALGKGVVIAESITEAEKTLKSFMVDKAFGDSGLSVVIEEFLEGKEISVHAFCDGAVARMFPIARDHKRIGEGNSGLNTGGMGTIAPVEISEALKTEILTTVIEPVLKGMVEEGIPFKGVLFPGIMVTKEGIKVLEFNARFGDPETQSYMRLLASDLLDVMLDCAEGKLSESNIVWRPEYVCTVILASGGYPEKYNSGYVISGLDAVGPETVVFEAGTALSGDVTLTAGGRVLGVSALGKSSEEATKNAYAAVKNVSFDAMYYRKDIGLDWGV
ncbi:phosphoribosylamine--glycine ligase [Patescibacteria group bacterium]|nr:MAG: phosphoribosylamine--glycine ligase [Patescibacteria group bacterium]